MTERFASAALIAGLALVACAPMDDEPERDIRAPAAVLIGEPVNCINRQDIDNLAIHDDYTIDFKMIGGTTYRSTLPSRCPTLGFEQRISYKTATSQICSTDIFHVVRSDGTQTVYCGFGKFTPVRVGGS